MSILRNPRHERFAQGLAKGLSGKAAYVEAGYRSTGNAAEVGAAKLVRNDKIAARVAELQARQVRRLDVTVESIVAELEEARAAALDHKQLAAAVAASLGKAKLLGLIVDRAEVESVIRKPMREPGQVEQMSLEQWQEKFAPKLLDQQSGNGSPATKPEKAEPAEEIGIVEALRRAKAARRGKATRF
ncbi:terminase small subunit [Mesorhizobium sp. VK24D]|uniref:Terminase small subunit n=1 Tax=Mesorhizobium album TaxID=3072314 RepID=A0ABU4Y897_9HYPH|nr:terminase small subunit [Mesorhizobium sp. VK24D]MDX8483162.1 terminase small subunit [Mesorhizobium sp. VK24D]